MSGVVTADVDRFRPGHAAGRSTSLLDLGMFVPAWAVGWLDRLADGGSVDAIAVQVNSVYDGRLKWRSRYLIHRARRRGRTGLLIQVDLRDPPRSMSSKWCLVSVTEGERRLCGVDRTNFRKVRFVPLPSGPHSLRLETLRTRRRRSTQVERKVVLGQGDILLVTCDPVQTNVFYRHSPEVDTWSLQILQ